MILPFSASQFNLKAIRETAMVAFNLDLSTEEKDITEPLVVLRKFKREDLGHLFFGFIVICTDDVTFELLPALRGFNIMSVQHGVKDIHIVSGSLERWVEVILTLSNEKTYLGLLQELNYLHRYLSSIGLHHLFKGYVEKSFKTAYVLEKAK